VNAAPPERTASTCGRPASATERVSALLLFQPSMPATLSSNRITGALCKSAARSCETAKDAQRTPSVTPDSQGLSTSVPRVRGLSLRNPAILRSNLTMAAA